MEDIQKWEIKIFLPSTRPRSLLVICMLSIISLISTLAMLRLFTSTKTTQNPFTSPLFYIALMISVMPAGLVYTEERGQELFQYIVWTIPAMLCLSSSYSLKMMGGMDMLFGELDAAKYKYKGA